jgi:ribonuclease P protein subunit RPR2
MPKKKDRKKAIQLVRELFSLARKDPVRSGRYTDLARKTAMKNRMSLPRDLKRQICKHCKTYLRPGKNCRVRLLKGNVVYCCQECGGYSRFGYKGGGKKSRS